MNPATPRMFRKARIFPRIDMGSVPECGKAGKIGTKNPLVLIVNDSSAERQRKIGESRAEGPTAAHGCPQSRYRTHLVCVARLDARTAPIRDFGHAFGGPATYNCLQLAGRGTDRRPTGPGGNPGPPHASRLRRPRRGALKTTQSAVQTIGNYDLLDKIAEGGMGAIYRGRDRRSGQIVAVKIMPAHMAANRLRAVGSG